MSTCPVSSRLAGVGDVVTSVVRRSSARSSELGLEGLSLERERVER
jgi:hypothetical protein